MNLLPKKTATELFKSLKKTPQALSKDRFDNIAYGWIDGFIASNETEESLQRIIVIAFAEIARLRGWD